MRWAVSRLESWNLILSWKTRTGDEEVRRPVPRLDSWPLVLSWRDRTGDEASPQVKKLASRLVVRK
jgi:hypothetical protein